MAITEEQLTQMAMAEKQDGQKMMLAQELRSAWAVAEAWRTAFARVVYEASLQGVKVGSPIPAAEVLAGYQALPWAV